MRKCIFCGDDAKTREHLWPKWILNKVRPRMITGFLGRNTNLRFNAEWKVRSVCKSCNGGWMSNLETANEPLIGPPIDDVSVTLDGPQRWAAAAWSIKTAMVMDSTTVGARPLFYTQTERDGMKASSLIPARTMVWLGRYLGGNAIAAGSLDTTYRFRDVGIICPGRITTLLLGCLVIQVMTVHIPPEYGDRATLINAAQGPWDQLLVTAWPNPRGRSSYWPPILAFDDSGALTDFSTLNDRWVLGDEIPL
jgi:hypothetical protein